jgi:hypothetical protein
MPVIVNHYFLLWIWCSIYVHTLMRITQEILQDYIDCIRYYVEPPDIPCVQIQWIPSCSLCDTMFTLRLCTWTARCTPGTCSVQQHLRVKVAIIVSHAADFIHPTIYSVLFSSDLWYFQNLCDCPCLMWCGWV